MDGLLGTIVVLLVFALLVFLVARSAKGLLVTGFLLAIYFALKALGVLG